MNLKKNINPFLIIMWLAIMIPLISNGYEETGTFPTGKVIMTTIAFLLGCGAIPTRLKNSKENEQKPHKVLKSENQENVGENMTVEGKYPHIESGSTVINNYSCTFTNSQLQQGNHNIMNLKKDDTEIETVKSLLVELKKITKNLPNNHQQSELQADIETIESQLKSPKPKIGFIKEICKSMRNVLEGSIGSTLATTYPYINELLKKLNS